MSAPLTIDVDPVYSMYGTDDLIRARECLGWDLLECQQSDEAPSTKANGIAFISLQIASINHELTRRERLRAMPGAPAWPSEPTEALRDHWRTIKDTVPLPVFWDRFFPSFPLRKTGRNWRGPCPIHGGRNETSASIFNDGRSFHCFTCGLSGDVFTLAGLVFQTTRFREIADRLASEFGIGRPVSIVPDDSSPSVSGIRNNPTGKKPAFAAFEIRDGKAVSR